MVVTSTTPGPLASPTVHVPVVGKPLIQMDVNDGLAIRGPRAAALGFRKVWSSWTKMSKPPIASEPWIKTPTVTFVPGVTGPIVGGLPAQLVAVGEAVIHTRPVAA